MNTIWTIQYFAEKQKRVILAELFSERPGPAQFNKLPSKSVQAVLQGGQVGITGQPASKQRVSKLCSCRGSGKNNTPACFKAKSVQAMLQGGQVEITCQPASIQRVSKPCSRGAGSLWKNLLDSEDVIVFFLIFGQDIPLLIPETFYLVSLQCFFTSIDWKPEWNNFRF